MLADPVHRGADPMTFVSSHRGLAAKFGWCPPFGFLIALIKNYDLRIGAVEDSGDVEVGRVQVVRLLRRAALESRNRRAIGIVAAALAPA